MDGDPLFAGKVYKGSVAAKDKRAMAPPPIVCGPILSPPWPSVNRTWGTTTGDGGKLARTLDNNY
jgi:hypothetical protein